MWQLRLYDSFQTELNEGDLVQIDSGRGNVFYAQVKLLEDENAFSPFHTFSFCKIRKIENLPSSAVKMDEDRYDCWYDAGEELKQEDYNLYYYDWKSCESRMNERSFRIFKISQVHQTKLF